MSSLMQQATVTPLFSQDDLVEARRVLNLEAEALLQLAQSLGGSFKGTIDLLMQTKGRVILSGIGKSGHIANKIASTFSSTGTPAFFVHPSEASHGDLGMITLEDTLIMLSLSGETAELSNMINYAKRFDIPIIAMTCKADSVLSKAALYTLLLPPSLKHVLWAWLLQLQPLLCSPLEMHLPLPF